MSRTRWTRLLATTAGVLTAAIVPVLAPHAASAACVTDPYSGVCVSPVTYKVFSTDGTLAVQKTPKVDNVVRWLKEGDSVGVVCQINNGGTDPYDNMTSHTWDYISTAAGTGWVYDHFITTPAQGTDGWSPGVRHCGSGGGSTSSLNPNNYPWPAVDGWVADGHGYYEGECVSFAAWAIRSDGMPHSKSPDWLGNADMWTGAYVDTSPHAGDIAQWDDKVNGAGDRGHVAYVAAVNSDGTIKVYEYNWGTMHRLNIRTIPANAPSRYLHF
ncbi:CHAP domain-containing protein [Microbispora corallina]|uniref:CHAP domain-containing protein n=1 Tax=Microbispora corallina TaxID=83302 RepID=UPI00195133C4|nr:CHAP domain-containing protein [Microbispora corallina]